MKRQIKAKIDQNVQEKSLRMGTNRWKRGLHVFGLCKTKTQRFIRNSMRNIQLWNDSMKEIEGRFGAAAETYFLLFRFLFIINSILTMATFTYVNQIFCLQRINFQIQNQIDFLFSDLSLYLS